MNLKPTKALDLPDWAKVQAVIGIMQTLNAGQESLPPKAMFVGGCVRNTLLGENVDDIDIATIHTTEEVIDLCKQEGIKIIPTGIDHGTVTAVVGKSVFEITTLRRDVKTDGRRAVVAYTDDWAEDAQRRDFTLNTLLMDMRGNIYDPTGRGLDDLTARRIVFVGDPAARIAEDALRILRFFRFHAKYGYGDPDKQAIAAIKVAATEVKTLSRERITQEFFKILSLKNASQTLELMFVCGVLNELVQEGYQKRDLEKLSYDQAEHDCVHLGARLCVLAQFDLEHIQNMSEFLLIPKAVSRDIETLNKALSEFKIINMKLLVYKIGCELTVQFLLLKSAVGETNEDTLSDFIQDTINCEVPVLPIGGQDIIDRGIVHGPDVGRILSGLEAKWIESDFSLTKEELCALIQP